MPLAVQIHHRRIRRCSGKIRYRTLERAQEALIRVTMLTRDGVLTDRAPERPMQVYECDLCGTHHLGHRPLAMSRR